MISDTHSILKEQSFFLVGTVNVFSWFMWHFLPHFLQAEVFWDFLCRWTCQSFPRWLLGFNYSKRDFSITGVIFSKSHVFSWCFYIFLYFSWWELCRVWNLSLGSRMKFGSNFIFWFQLATRSYQAINIQTFFILMNFSLSICGGTCFGDYSSERVA